MSEEVNSPKTDEDDDLSYLFTWDKNPSHISDDLDIPAYSSKFQVLKHVKDEVEEKKPRSRPSVTCWNCGGSHNLRDCPEPRNQAVIAKKRAESQSQSKFTKAVRYHADEEQKYPHLHPGKISDRLREAMGLRPDQAPRYIYRMRELGYPPGWVEEARVSHSGLSMFDSCGKEVKDPELEDGEIKTHADRDKYDFQKLIEYPGFNVPFEPGTIDETEELGARPMRESQSIKHMQQLWSGKKTGSYRRKRLKMQTSTDSPSVSIRSTSPEEADMELDTEQEEVKFLSPTDDFKFVPPLPVSGPRNPPPPTESPPPDESGNYLPPARGVKRKLSLTNDDLPPGEEPEKLDDTTSSTEKPDSTDNKKTDCNKDKRGNCSSPAETYNGRVKSVSTGTPVIIRSEFKRLPSPEKFSKDICDVINFENLPNATGKYDQMHGLIKKVRTYVSQSLLKADVDEDDDDEG